MSGGARTRSTMAMAVSGLLMAHHVAGKASRDAIFLSQFSMTNLPAMVTVRPAGRAIGFFPVRETRCAATG